MTPTETAMAKAKANQKKRRKTSKLTLSRQSMKKALNNLRKKTPKKTKSPRKKRKSSRKKSSKKCKICGFDCDVGMFNMNACTCNHTNCRGYKLSKRQISLAKEFGDRVFSLKMDQMTSAQLAMERAKLNRLSGKVNLSEIVQFTDYGEQIVRGVPSKKYTTPSQLAMERARNNRKGSSSKKLTPSQIAMERARNNRRNR
jgi:hypothetical protein